MNTCNKPEKVKAEEYMEKCVEPDAPWVTCFYCGKPLKTCERTEPVENSYICPVHNDGVEIDCNGLWACDNCWHKYIDRYDGRIIGRIRWYIDLIYFTLKNLT